MSFLLKSRKSWMTGPSPVTTKEDQSGRGHCTGERPKSRSAPTKEDYFGGSVAGAAGGGKGCTSAPGPIFCRLPTMT